jgi:heat shock protein 1/8
MSVVIPRNSVIPTKKTKIYSTDTDEQSSIIIKIYEGERKLTKHNVHIANFELSGFHKGPKGNPRINITFHVDINGILQVTAHEKRSGVENSIKITSSNSAKGRLSQNEIEQLINEAQMNEEFDSLYVMKLNLNHQISNNCTLILSNINNEMCTIPTAEKKKIKSEIKKIQKQLLDDLSIDELKNISEKIHKNYTSYIIQINKENSEFKCNTTNVGSHIHDNDDVETYKYDAIVIPNDASDYEVEEIKTLKKSISNLCNDIKSIITNPVSKFIEDDIMLMSDYIDSVQIWLFTTNAKATKDFVVKMNEVHQFTEEIMKKYENKEIFEINEKFTQKDELEMVCCTINNSIKENYFLLNTSDMEKLVTKITDTMKWIHDYPNEHEDIYINKKIEIKNLCNEVYNNMNSNTTISTETETDSDDDDNEPEKVQICNMNKNIDKLIDNLPTMISRQPKEKDVLLKINIDLDDIKFK